MIYQDPNEILDKGLSQIILENLKTKYTIKNLKATHNPVSAWYKVSFEIEGLTDIELKYVKKCTPIKQNIKNIIKANREVTTYYSGVKSIYDHDDCILIYCNNELI